MIQLGLIHMDGSNQLIHLSTHRREMEYVRKHSMIQLIWGDDLSVKILLSFIAYDIKS